MTDARARMAWPLLLMLAFAVHTGMTVALTGRLHGAALAAAQALGALALAAIAAGRPIAAVRAMDARSRALACAGGLAGILGPVAVVAALRMSDAPAGSVVVFWMAGGWAAIAAVAAAGVAVRSKTRARGPLALAGGFVAFAGVAGIVANWERPSSFSPLVRFPAQELAILAAGALMLGGAFAVLRAARGRRVDGALVCAAAAASAAGLVWWGVTGVSSGFASLAEQPVQVVVAALSWGAVCLALPRVLRAEGPARVGALIAPAPLLLSALIWLEQAVGAAGPQPMIVTGVAAGCVTLAAGSLVLWSSAQAAPEAATRRRLRVAASCVPLALAGVALAFPAIIAHANVSGSAGSFVGSWTLLGWESVAGVTAMALASLLAALALTRERLWAALAALAAYAAWPWSLATPMHVLSGFLPPGVEQYYGTEYGSIDFTSAPAPWMTAAVVACAAGFAAFIAFDMWRRFHTAAPQGK
jgi:hypothetical protein